MAENTKQVGKVPMIESSISARGPLPSDGGVSTKTNSKVKMLDNYGNGLMPSNNLSTNINNNDDLVVPRAFEETSHRAAAVYSPPKTSSSTSLDQQFKSFRDIIGTLDDCWSDLEQSIAPPLEKNKDSLEYKLDRLVFGVKNCMPQPIQRNSKLNEIGSFFQSMSHSNIKECVKPLKDMIDEECNLIKSLCDLCTVKYNDLLQQLKHIDAYFQHGFTRWDKIRHHVSTARNDAKSIFQWYVRSASDGTDSNTGTSLSLNTNLKSKRGNKLPSTNGMKSNSNMIYLPSMSSIAAPNGSGRNSMKRKRSISPHPQKSSGQKQQPKRSKASSVQPNAPSFISSTTASLDPAATHSTSVTARNQRHTGSSRRNKPAQRKRKTKVTVSVADNDVDQFQRSFLIEDKNPGRLTNPLLELPQYSCQSKTDVLPQASELLTLMDLYFPQPDTYPISYYARLLGFDIPASATDDYNEFDAQTVSLMDRTKDEAYRIPHLGPWAKDVINRPNSLEDERRLDLLDPVLNNLLEDIISLRKDSFTEAAKETFISKDCLDYARSHGMIDDLEFRTLRNGDESCLTLGNDMIRPENELVDTNMRSQGNCIIAAISKSRQCPIGLIRYSFLWFKISNLTTNKQGRLSSAISNPSSKKSSELIIRVKSLGDFSSCSGGNTASTITLLALALEHARRLNVWYGILDPANTHYSSFFSKYFRMNFVQSSSGDKMVVSDSTMFVNLHRLNFNYSVALWIEEQHGIIMENKQSEQNERMIVLLGNNYASEENSLQRTTSAGSSRMLHQSVLDQTLSSAITVRLTYNTESRRNDDDTRISIECLSSASAKTMFDKVPNTAQNETSLSLPVSSLPSWDVLKCFACTTVAEKQQLDHQETFVEQELRKKQESLTQLEMHMVPKLRQLLGAAYEERLHFENRESVQAALNNASTLVQYESLLKRKLEVSLAKESQLEIDMDAVCHVCNDGEVTPTNQIIFCDSCNVAVHQNCYDIKNVPEGDYFCIACKFFKYSASRSSHEEKRSPPIVCELCPSREGAFYRCHTSRSSDPPVSLTDAVKWCHVVCAKWQGIVCVDESEKVLEDVRPFKEGFVRRGVSCCLCEGERGTYNKCHTDGCEKYMHITCARASGLCHVKHGENHEGILHDDQSPWTLFCPDHSPPGPDRSDIVDTSEKLQRLKDAAKSFPPEPKPLDCMNYHEREKYLENSENEYMLYQRLFERRMLHRCEVCDVYVGLNDSLLICGVCNVSFHGDCFPGWNSKESSKGNSMVTCHACMYASLHSQTGNFEKPYCHMCNCSDGLLMKSLAVPVSMVKWRKGNQSHYKRSLFGKQIWCHTMCALWHDFVFIKDNNADCSNIVLGDGKSHIDGKKFCILCGRKDKVKTKCRIDNCRLSANECRHPSTFHASCARQAGFEFKDSSTEVYSQEFSVLCFNHTKYYEKFRDLLKTILERNSRQSSEEDIAVIYDRGIAFLKILGWAWRWSDWWILLNQSHVDDARRCQLAAFGAALRNRDYDKEPGDDSIALSTALRGILKTKSLVGGFNNNDVDILATWLARIYRTKNPRLSFGKDSIPVATNYENDSPVFYNDGKPKYELGTRPLPGKCSKEDFHEEHLYQAPIVSSPKSNRKDKSARSESFDPTSSRTYRVLIRCGGKVVVFHELLSATMFISGTLNSDGHFNQRSIETNVRNVSETHMWKKSSGPIDKVKQVKNSNIVVSPSKREGRPPKACRSNLPMQSKEGPKPHPEVGTRFTKRPDHQDTSPTSAKGRMTRSSSQEDAVFEQGRGMKRNRSHDAEMVNDDLSTAKGFKPVGIGNIETYEQSSKSCSTKRRRSLPKSLSKELKKVETGPVGEREKHDSRGDRVDEASGVTEIKETTSCLESPGYHSNKRDKKTSKREPKSAPEGHIEGKRKHLEQNAIRINNYDQSLTAKIEFTSCLESPAMDRTCQQISSAHKRTGKSRVSTRDNRYEERYSPDTRRSKERATHASIPDHPEAFHEQSKKRLSPGVNYIKGNHLAKESDHNGKSTKRQMWPSKQKIYEIKRNGQSLVDDTKTATQKDQFLDGSDGKHDNSNVQSLSAHDGSLNHELESVQAIDKFIIPKKNKM